MSDPVHVATVVRSRGNRGEVVVHCPGGHPERWRDLAAAHVGRDATRARSWKIERAWLHDGRLVMHFEGVTDIGTARSLVGHHVFIDRSELPALEDATWYACDLAGARVIDDRSGRLLGHVEDTISASAQDRLVVRTGSGAQVDVPLVRAIVRSVDAAAGCVRIDPPAGLMEENPAPGPGEPPVNGGGEMS
ncbi:MAG: ribosome maturation factor RimM [Acidobacteriota bacterium]